MLLCFLPIAVDVEPRGGCGGGVGLSLLCYKKIEHIEPT